MLQAPLNYVLIPAASLHRVLRGIHRGSVDAVSDTFRFLPFIFPPTQSPCTVAGECCWNLRFSQIQRGRRKCSESRSLQHHLSQITNTKAKVKFYFLCLYVCCLRCNWSTLLPMCLELKWVYLNMQIHCNPHVKHTEVTHAMIYYGFISVYEQQSVIK